MWMRSNPVGVILWCEYLADVIDIHSHVALDEQAVKLVEQLGGKVVKMIFVMELAGLKGREKLKDYDVESLIVYEGK